MANKYIRSGASGTGSGDSWTDAYASFTDAGLNNSTSSAPRGNVYYVADGEYGYVVFYNAASSNSVITIKKATIASHGTETGWSDSYGDGQATFSRTGGNVWWFRSPYWIIDGVTGGGPGSWDSGFGFVNTVTLTGSAQRNLYTSNVSNGFVTIEHTQLVQPETLHDYYDNDGVYLQRCDEYKFRYCSFKRHGRCAIFLSGCTNLFVEYSYIYYNGTSSLQHVAALADNSSSDVVIANNLWHDCNGTAYIDSLSRGGGETRSDRYLIYGNVFYASGARVTVNGYDCSDGCIVIINGGDSQMHGGSGWRVYNNTLYGLVRPDGSSAGISFAEGLTRVSDCLAYNNLFYGVDDPQIAYEAGQGTHDYNRFVDCTGTLPTEANRTTGSGDPFTNVVGLDFSITSPQGPGVTLASPYSTDIVSNPRGNDAFFDCGAYEYVDSTSGATTLASDGKRRYWRIKARDDLGRETPWSLYSYFDMAILAAGNPKWKNMLSAGDVVKAEAKLIYNASGNPTWGAYRVAGNVTGGTGVAAKSKGQRRVSVQVGVGL